MYIMQNNNLSGTTVNTTFCTVFFEGSLGKEPKASVSGILDNNTCKVLKGTQVEGTQVVAFDGVLPPNPYQPNNSYSLRGSMDKLAIISLHSGPKIFSSRG